MASRTIIVGCCALFAGLAQGCSDTLTRFAVPDTADSTASDAVTTDDADVLAQTDAPPDVGAELPTDTSSDGAGPEDTTPDTADLPTDSAETSEPDGVGPADLDLPNSCGATKACSGATHCSSGVCVTDPPQSTVAAVTDPSTHASAGDAPSLACVGVPPASTAGPSLVTLWGAVTRVGSGRPTGDMEVAVFQAASWDPSACDEQLTRSQREACYRDHAAPLASAISVLPAPIDPAPACTSPDFNDDCPMGYVCGESDGAPLCDQQFGRFQIPGVPTNRALILRVRYAGGDPSIATKWHDTYHFGVWLAADHADAGGNYRYDVTAIPSAMWTLLPNTVGLPGLPADHGITFGRIQDCGLAGQRAGWPISDATIGFGHPPGRIAYFNDRDNDWVPLSNRTTTNLQGRFAALDLPSGWNVAAAVARVDGSNVSLGHALFYTVPNALSVISFPGIHPASPQQPTDDFPQ
ncbi:MAG: hypothetical protein H6744_14995 [Deltaproteobacteria bacterium]|nr:hypothetical protein [Deltaproteobacteria bacterium]